MSEPRVWEEVKYGRNMTIIGKQGTTLWLLPTEYVHLISTTHQGNVKDEWRV